MPSRTLLLALVLAVVAAGACVVSAVGLLRSAPRPETAVAVSSEPSASFGSPPDPAVRATGVLRAWDAARSDAWARGDPDALRVLYVPGSRAGARDRAMLRAWSERGLVVTGLRTQLLAVSEVARSARSWTLRVTDRLAGGTAVAADGSVRSLPVDVPTTRTLELRRLAGRWVVASVRGATSTGGAGGASGGR